ncbi:MAG: XRE family transcriptional regulator [Anaerolineaceae bacterium]|nr:XRE family transcriptional regulator [Anaerolineaceae bacterium]
MAIGERIKLARKRMNMSQDALAQLAQVSKMAISKYEREQDIPSSGVLLRLSAALQVPVEFFFRPPGTQVQIQEFRKHATLGMKRQQAIMAQIQEWLERYFEIEMILQEEPPAPFDLYHLPAGSSEDVESAAMQLRDRWGLGEDAIENLMELLEDKQIKVGLVNGFDHFDACTFRANGSPVIVTKAGQPGDRQRFNLAHELGHLVLDVKEGLEKEKAAHRFAGAFLVPAITVRRELGNRRTDLNSNELYLLKRKYGLSMQAWVKRAADLEIIQKHTAERLFRSFSFQGWRKVEPGEQLAPEQPLRMQRLVYRALAEDLISPTRAEELLGQALVPVYA